MCKWTFGLVLATRHRSWVFLAFGLLAIGCDDAQPVADKPSPKVTPRSNAAPKASADVAHTPTATLAAEASPSQAGVMPASTVAQPVFRPDDDRPHRDDAALAALGIHRYDSRRLRLYTDIDAATARPLPALIDAAFDALSTYFGPLPPSRLGDDFQMTGYLIQQESLFRETGLIPQDLPPFEHGRHRRFEFWLRDQAYDYYRRHLLIHEATHCVMTILPESSQPVWYFEGMAELFGAHRLVENGPPQFRQLPDAPEHFAGFGRISLIRQAIQEARGKSLPEVAALRPEEYLQPEPYAWSWAVCCFLDHHPRYRERFRALGEHRTARSFATALDRTFAGDIRDLATEWSLFTANLQYGYDVPRSAIEFHAGQPLAIDAASQVRLAADRGWQSAGCRLESGRTYRIRATGPFTLADAPKPWLSEADGISFRYFNGQPLGKLLGCLRDEDGPAGGPGEPMLRVFPLGKDSHFTAPITGTLYLRLNDAWSELADNRGEVSVEVRRMEE